MSDAATEGPKAKCRDCGKVTYGTTVGVPGGSCPAREQIYATHRWRVCDD